MTDDDRIVEWAKRALGPEAEVCISPDGEPFVGGFSEPLLFIPNVPRAFEALKAALRMLANEPERTIGDVPFTRAVEELPETHAKLARYEQKRALLMRLVVRWQQRVKGTDKGADTAYLECVGDVRAALQDEPE